MLIIGISQPMFTFTHFYFFDDTFSLASGVFHLLSQGEIILFVLLFCFSLLMPALKMLMLLYTININSLHSQRHSKNLYRIGLIGKWSMLDVFVIAIMAVTIKLSMVAEVTIHAGLIVFSLGVIASMLLPQIIQPPLALSNHTVLQLTPEDLDCLFEQGQLTLFEQPFYSQHQLIDIIDRKNVWCAKAQVIHITKQQVTLQLLAKRE